MEFASLSPPPPVKSGRLIEELCSKLKIDGFVEEKQERPDLEKSEEINGGMDEEEEEEEDEEEFSFAVVNTDGSLISAEEAFQDGQIRPVYPLFDRDLLAGYEFHNTDGVSTSLAGDGGPVLRPPLKKLFVENQDSEDEDSTTAESELHGSYCQWPGRTVSDASPDSCRKSNSTGFSKIRRFRDLVLRSNSDGKDAFVFLNESSSSSSSSEKKKVKKIKWKKEKKTSEKKGKKDETTPVEKDGTTSSAHEKLYKRNRAMKEEGKRRSYLPYKQVGFFTNVNGLSRNIHPF